MFIRYLYSERFGLAAPARSSPSLLPTQGPWLLEDQERNDYYSESRNYPTASALKSKTYNGATRTASPTRWRHVTRKLPSPLSLNAHEPSSSLSEPIVHQGGTHRKAARQVPGAGRLELESGHRQCIPSTPPDPGRLVPSV